MSDYTYTKADWATDSGPHIRSTNCHELPELNPREPKGSPYPGDLEGHACPDCGNPALYCSCHDQAPDTERNTYEPNPYDRWLDFDTDPDYYEDVGGLELCNGCGASAYDCEPCICIDLGGES